MAKKRRKLNKDFERTIYSSKKNVELVLAKIYDIDDEDIQKEYMSAFNDVVSLYDELKEDYEEKGFNDNSEKLFANYKDAFNLLLEADKTVRSELNLLISFLRPNTFCKIFCLLKSPYTIFDTKFSPFKINFAFEL